jgi:hypothetical protein
VTKVIFEDRVNKEIRCPNDDSTADLESEFQAFVDNSGFTELSSGRSDTTEGSLFELDELLRAASNSVDSLFKTSAFILTAKPSSTQDVAHIKPVERVKDSREAKVEGFHVGKAINKRALDSTFKELRNILYTNLVGYCCIPQVEIDGVVTDQLERPFFPDGTATRVLTFSKLERLFTSIIPGGQAITAAFRPTQLAHNVEARMLHKFLAILIILRCDIQSFLSFTEKLVAPQTWTADDYALAKLPAEHRDSLRAIFGDDMTANIFFQKQHDFFAPIIEKNKEVRSRFRRVPYVREKLIGQGSFGKIYEVDVRLGQSNHHLQTSMGMAHVCL